MHLFTHRQEDSAHLQANMKLLRTYQKETVYKPQCFVKSCSLFKVVFPHNKQI